MGKEKPYPTKTLSLISAPVIYVSDCSEDGRYVRGLAEYLPVVYTTTYDIWCSFDRAKRSSFDERVVLVGETGKNNSTETKRSHTRNTQNLVTKSHFISVNIVDEDPGTAGKISDGDHLDIKAGDDTALKIYQWLFSVLTVREMLFIIPKKEMAEISQQNWPGHKYCRLIDVKKTAKDTDVQCVVLIVSKAQVNEGKTGKCLRWEVIDNSATAHFVFHWRGSDSQLTWDWVTKFKPGDRVALGRRSQVLVKEKRSIRLIKSPFRATSFILRGSASILHKTAGALQSTSHHVSKGNGSLWVAKSDIGADGKLVEWAKVNEAEDRAVMEGVRSVKVFNEKGSFTWSDDASVASTHIGDEMNEKLKI